jgi:hypothetical protein
MTTNMSTSNKALLVMEVKVHLGPCVGFGGLMTNNLRSNLVLRVL